MNKNNLQYGLTMIVMVVLFFIFGIWVKSW